MYFTIERATGGYMAYAKGANHQIVFWTQIYNTKASAEQAVRWLQTNISGAVVHDLT